jgi:hypothetical protein
MLQLFEKRFWLQGVCGDGYRMPKLSATGRGGRGEMKKLYVSNVLGHKGPCVATWINTNEIDRRFGNGGYYSGYFKLIRLHGFLWRKIGPEFHGFIDGNRVFSTLVEEESG